MFCDIPSRASGAKLRHSEEMVLIVSGILVKEKQLFVSDKESFVGVQQGMEKAHTGIRPLKPSFWVPFFPTMYNVYAQRDALTL